MGNLIPTTVFSERYTGRVPTEILTFSAEVTGRIREMHLSFELMNSLNAYITVRRAGSFILNGTNQSIPTSFFKPVNGIDILLSKTGLDIPVTRGNLVEVRMVTTLGSTRSSGTAEFLMVTEEGV